MTGFVSLYMFFYMFFAAYVKETIKMPNQGMALFRAPF